ncbi:16925_t:CDS:2 [Acaulospora colombiana]|uniref:16925_t:CDS:1 n=1 Tax=Acaulospora colombiana TaxID=27376 RepID=A0ACA9LCG9_9GLOM|nr:16925_t:CDS:2 [Acaulospora colombiana]
MHSKSKSANAYNKNMQVRIKGDILKEGNGQSPFPYILIDVTELDDNLGYVANVMDIKSREQAYMYLIDKTNNLHIAKTRSLTHFMSQLKFTPYLQHLLETIEDENYLALVWEDPGTPLSEILANSDHMNNISLHLDSNRNIDIINREQTFKSPPIDISQDLDFRKTFCQVCWGLANLHENNLAHMNINLDTIWIKQVDRMKDDKRVKESEARIVDFSSLGHFITTNPVRMHAWYNGNNKSSSIHNVGEKSFEEHDDYRDNENSFDVFVAPEIVNEQPCWGWRPDVWSLGVVLYFFITRNFPCDGDYQRFHWEIASGKFEYPEGMDPDAVDLLKQMWNPDPTVKFDMWDVKKHAFLSPSSTNSTVNSAHSLSSASASLKASFESEVQHYHKDGYERHRSSHSKNLLKRNIIPKNVLRNSIFMRNHKDDDGKGGKNVPSSENALVDPDSDLMCVENEKQNVKNQKGEMRDKKRMSLKRGGKKRIGKGKDGKDGSMVRRIKCAVKRLANICHPESAESRKIRITCKDDESEIKDDAET